jgi:hypothetical protein
MALLPYRYKIVGWLLGIAFFSGCEEQVQWDLEPSESVIVVDAIITNELKQQEVYVYSSSATYNVENMPISEAEVKLWDGTQFYNFEPSDTPGLYVSSPFAASINKAFALIISYENISDTAVAVMEAITPFKNDTVFYKDGLYRFIYGGSDLPAMTEVYYDWSHDSDYCQSYGNCSAQSTHYTLSNVDIAEEFGPAKQEIWFPSGTILVRKKYSLSTDHQDFIRSLLIETEWRGGLFDMEQGNVPTNFNHGVKGWFGVCMVISDTAVIN